LKYRKDTLVKILAMDSYERGASSVILIDWDDKAQALMIGKVATVSPEHLNRGLCASYVSQMQMGLG
jgi:16S rRNA G966 N2-methylase RsmD